MDQGNFDPWKEDTAMIGGVKGTVAVKLPEFSGVIIVRSSRTEDDPLPPNHAFLMDWGTCSVSGFTLLARSGAVA